MGRLFIFSNSSRIDFFIRDIFMPDDSYMLFETHIDFSYKINGGPIQSYKLSTFKNDTMCVYDFNNISNSINPLKFKYNEKSTLIKHLSTYTEICIVSSWDSVDDYFVSLYNYLFSLSNTRNDCLPISVCDPATDLFQNRQSLNDYMKHAQRVKAYYNKEYMNIAVINYFSSVHNVSITFDELVMLHVIDRCTEKLTHCPSYFIYNNLNNNLITMNESFKLLQNLYKLNYITNYEHNSDICITTLKDYKVYKNRLREQGINYECTVDIFEKFLRYEHNKFKQYIEKYFEKLEKINKKDIVCN